MGVVHVAARAVQILCREDTVARKVVEYVAEDIGAALVLVGGVISVAHVHPYGRISARNEEFRGYDVDLSRGLPAPHRHGLYLFEIHRVGSEVQTAAREILNIWRYALAVYAVEEDGEVEKYKLVTSIRGNSMENRVSIESPIGKALKGHRVGDRVLVKVNENVSYLIIRSIDKTGDEDENIRSF